MKVREVTEQTRWLNDEEQALWRLMLAVTRKVDRVMDETLQLGSELSTPEFSVLVTLSEAEEHCLRLRDLCQLLEWDRSRTSHQITRMVRRGLVEKRKSAGDARGVIVALTPEGMQRLESAAPGHVEAVRRIAFDHMTTDQAAVLRDYLQQIMTVDNVPGTEGFCGNLFADTDAPGAQTPAAEPKVSE